MKRLLPKEKAVISFKRFKIPYRLYGQGANIVCLNGAQQSSAMWLSFIKHFSAQYQITLFDFPHQGKATLKNPSQPVSLDEQVNILDQVIRKLKIKEPTICSASWGGVVALAFARKYPQDVKRLILASIGLRPNLKMRSAITNGVNTKNNERKKMADVLIDSFGKKLPSKVKSQITSQFKTMSEERIKAFSEHGLSVLMKGSLDKVVELDKIKTPTTILYGKEDMIIDYQDAKQLVDKLPKSKMKTIAGVGHFLHLEDEKVLKIYESILAN
ncbi:MAG: alpha/beta hydrolase [Candidatus Omnitrophica bacterium]|nr:alpha/beta hydrolase [Candidatus Omnitrophota bacterium]